MAELPAAIGSWLWRGFPAGIDGLGLDQIEAQGWTAADLLTPVAVLSAPALRHNQAALDTWAASLGCGLAPHAKTTMSPELMRQQLDAGAWALTAANPWQASVMAAAGAPRVVLANEVASAASLAALLRQTEVWVFVDSPASVEVVVGAAREADVTVRVLLEVGFPGGRGGVRDADAAVRTAAACRTPGVRLSGYALFEGILAASRSAADRAAVEVALGRAVAILDAVQAAQPVAAPVVTGGGSMFPDLVADALGAAARRYAGRLVLRPGCYLIHDHGAYARAYGQQPWLDLVPALTVLTTVLSVPEPGLALLDGGKRDLSLDGQPAPVVSVARAGREVQHPDLAVTRSNDQHSYLEWDPSAWAGLQVGDRVTLGVSHPCVTMQLWRALPLLGGDRVVGAVRTCF